MCATGVVRVGLGGPGSLGNDDFVPQPERTQLRVNEVTCEN